MTQYSYYDGNGLYQGLYDVVLAKFPKYPNRYITTHSQNFLGIVASAYMAYHDYQTHPLAFVKKWEYLYFLDAKVQRLLEGILASADCHKMPLVLNRLLDEAILNAYYDRPVQKLIKNLVRLNTLL